MDAGGARLLRQAGDRLLDLAPDRHHQVGELVDDDHDARQVAVLQAADASSPLARLDRLDLRLLVVAAASSSSSSSSSRPSASVTCAISRL